MILVCPSEQMKLRASGHLRKPVNRKASTRVNVPVAEGPYKWLSNQSWPWHMPLILVFGRQRQGDLWV